MMVPVIKIKKKLWITGLMLIMLNVSLSPLLFGAVKQGTLEIFLGNYSINEPRFKAVYESGSILRGLVLSSNLAYDFNFYLEIKQLYREGELTFTKEESKFLLFPISLGVRYVKPGKLLQPYLGAGIDFYFYLETNKIGTVVNSTRGYHVLGGAYLQFGEKVPLMLNLKAKYTFAKTEEKNIQVELGGLEYGASLVFAF